MRFYKRDPNAALAGMAALTLKQRGAYNSLIDLLYASDGEVPDDDKVVAKLIGCHWREWGAVKRQLIEAGKVRVEGVNLMARRVQETLKEASELSQKQSKRASGRWVKSKNTNENNTTTMQGGNAIKSQSHSHSQSQTAPADKLGLEETKKIDATRLATLSQLLDLDYNRHPLGTIAYINQLIDLERAGVDIEADLIPCIQRMKSDGRRVEGKPFSYFRQAALDFQRARTILADVQREIETQDPISVAPGEWPIHVENWLFEGRWDMRIGPAPIQEGCRAPEAWVCGARKAWNGPLGQRPFCKLVNNFYIPIWWQEEEQYYGRSYNRDDMIVFLSGGPDPRKRPPGMVADGNVVPLRKAL